MSKESEGKWRVAKISGVLVSFKKKDSQRYDAREFIASEVQKILDYK